MLFLCLMMRMRVSHQRPTSRKLLEQMLPADTFDVIRRIPRSDEPGPDAKGDLKLLHAPCEFDLIRYTSINYFPSYCLPVYTNRHVNEDWYRLYRTYDTEGYVFGQFYERLQRYELD
ncbi:GD25836 [Drosophila simulans]|nr:GD25836 [Drosophila simulans]